jgi:DNA mismatch repair protein MutS
MPFSSILFDEPVDSGYIDRSTEPAFFADLNLDQLVDAITANYDEYQLKPFFYRQLHDANSITYRHEIMQDLETDAVVDSLMSFAANMGNMRRHLIGVDRLRHKYQQESWFLDAVEIYCQAVATLTRDLTRVGVRSRGLAAFRDYLGSHIESPIFQQLTTETSELKDELAAVRYCVHIRGPRVQVTRYAGEADYSVEVLDTFGKFRQSGVRDYSVGFSSSLDMNNVEARILDCVVQLYPDVFSALDKYCERHRTYVDETVCRFDREIQFYIAYLAFTNTLKARGLHFCYPQVSDSKEVYADGTFDVALAPKLVTADLSVVTNDLQLTRQERIFVVTGPNQGGKTTFARTFGQLHYFGSLGLPVAGRRARIYMFDRLFTHFEKEENLEDLRSKLEDDLFRIHNIVEKATERSIVVVNELFSSTTSYDALYLGRKIIERLIQLNVLAVYVTFVEELSSFGVATVSMVSCVAPDNPALRTYKVERRPADGRAYAITLAEKYGLTRGHLGVRSRS